MLIGQKGVKYGLSLPTKGGGGDGDDDEKDKRRPIAPPASVANAFSIADADDDDDEGEDGNEGAKRALQRDIALQAAKKAADAKVGRTENDSDQEEGLF